MDELLRQLLGVGLDTAFGSIVFMIGAVSLPRDLQRPFLGGAFGVPLDVLLIILGVWVIVGG